MPGNEDNPLGFDDDDLALMAEAREGAERAALARAEAELALDARRQRLAEAFERRLEMDRRLYYQAMSNCAGRW